MAELDDDQLRYWLQRAERIDDTTPLVGHSLNSELMTMWKVVAELGRRVMGT